MLKLHDTISSIRHINSTGYQKHYEEGIDGYNQYANLMLTKIIQRLYCFLSSRIPHNRIDLMAGVHWVWNSLHSKAQKISIFMITSGHMVDFQDIKCHTNEESLLTNHHNFVNTKSMTATEDYNGSYLVFDSKKYHLFRAGAASTGTMKRLKENQQSSKMTTYSNRYSKFYSVYPIIECDKDNLTDDDVTMGRFDQLEQYIGIRFSIVDKSIVFLFGWKKMRRIMHCLN